MKISSALAFTFGILVCSPFANAESSRMSRLNAQVQQWASIESQLGSADLRAWDESMDSTDAILARYPAPFQLLCLSNGREAPNEKFRITNLATGANLGGETSGETCRQLLAIQNQNLLCIPNGQSGVYEEFGMYDLGRRQTIGGYTGIRVCQTLVTTARLMLACLSNGQTSTYEKFHLYNRGLEKQLGGDVSLDQCLASLGS